MYLCTLHVAYVLIDLIMWSSFLEVYSIYNEENFSKDWDLIQVEGPQTLKKTPELFSDVHISFTSILKYDLITDL